MEFDGDASVGCMTGTHFWRPVLVCSSLGAFLGMIVVGVPCYLLSRLDFWEGANLGEVPIGISVVFGGLAGLLIGAPTGAFAGLVLGIMVSDWTAPTSSS